MRKAARLGVFPPGRLSPSLLPLLGRVRTWEMVAEKINHGFQAAEELKRKRGGIGILMLGGMQVLGWDLLLPSVA